MAVAQATITNAMPDGALRIQGFEDWLLRDAIGAPTAADRPHGAWTIIGGFRGMGAGLDGLFEMLGAGTDDGVMFGTCRVEQLRPLERDREYIVRCAVVGSKRRHGRRVPVFDVVEYVTEIADADGVAVRTTSSMVVPRQEVQA
jgi:hypothetical protein